MKSTHSTNLWAKNNIYKYFIRLTFKLRLMLTTNMQRTWKLVRYISRLSHDNICLSMFSGMVRTLVFHSLSPERHTFIQNVKILDFFERGFHTNIDELHSGDVGTETFHLQHRLWFLPNVCMYSILLTFSYKTPYCRQN